MSEIFDGLDDSSVSENLEGLDRCSRFGKSWLLDGGISWGFVWGLFIVSSHILRLVLGSGFRTSSSSDIHGFETFSPRYVTCEDRQLSEIGVHSQNGS